MFAVPVPILELDTTGPSDGGESDSCEDSACINADLNDIYTTHGGTSATGCRVRANCDYECTNGYFQDGCSSSTYGVCNPCTGLPVGTYWISNGGVSDSCMYDNCTNALVNEIYVSNGTNPHNCRVIANCSDICPIGKYLNQCNSTSIGSCIPCTNATVGMYWVTSGRMSDTCKEEPCINPLSSGEFYSSHGGTHAAGCVIANCTTSDITYPEYCNITCENNCGIGMYRSNCTNSSTGMCISCSITGIGKWFSSGGGLEDECEERNCTNAKSNQYYISHGGTDPNGCQVVNNCSQICPAGMYLHGCSSQSIGTCVHCSNASVGEYWVTHGWQNDSCVSSPCINKGWNEVYQSHGGSNSSGCNVTLNCTADCGIGFYRSGCDRNSYGTCERCSGGQEWILLANNWSFQRCL